MADSTLFFDCEKAIRDRLAANWSTLPVVSDNDDGNGLDLSAGFVRVVIGFADSDFATINGANPLTRTTGVIGVDVFTLVNTGTGLGKQYAGEIAAVFRGKSFSGVLCYAPTIVTSKQIDYSVGKYWVTPVICPFQYDRHVSI